ncbi:MAG: hypothetical protein K6G60_04515 [Lachnospiraceae bacterium]|nr:hypothetical protein [Lachnospiraceae bacterium]
MLKRFKRFIQDKGLVKETVNIIMGILMAVALLVFSFTRSIWSICVVIILGALMNVMNGLSMLRKKERKTMGMSMIFLGIIVVFVFIVYFANGYI